MCCQNRSAVYLVDEAEMSLSEHAKYNGRMSPPTDFSRSFSAGAMLGHKRSNSLGGTSSTAGTPTLSSQGRPLSYNTANSASTLSSSKSLYSPTGGVLGQNFSGTSPSGSRKGTKNSIWGMSVKVKSSKTPQPVHSQAMFEAVGRGLRECITVAEDDITSLKSNIECISVSSGQGKLYDLEKQLKAAERYLKRVEFQLSKLEELFDQYELQQKLRDGVRSMAYAYVLSPGKEKNTALSNVRSGFKECSDVMCAIENELEQMMGTLTLQMKGIQGFARLCPGDVFEIGIKHGSQKWKSKGRVMKNSEQTWVNEQTTFKVLLADVLVIKAIEVKGLGKNALLGNKFCDTADLFSAHPQIMTVNLNSSGSLKLNLIVTWNPLHLVTEDYHPSIFSSNSMRSTRAYGAHSPVSPSSHDGEFLSNPFMSRMKSMTSIQSPDRDSGNHELSSNSSNDAYSSRSSTVIDGRFNNGEEFSQKPSVLTDNDQVDSATINVQPKVNGSVVHSSIKDSFNQQNLYRAGSPVSCSGTSFDTSSSLRGSGSQLDIVTIPVTGSHSLQETINSVISYLEDLQGQYPELQGLETIVLELDEYLRNNKQKSRRCSISSTISISVENALGCFDFLDTEDDSENYPHERLNPEEISLEKLSNSKCIDQTALDQGFASFNSENSDKNRQNRIHNTKSSALHSTIDSYEQIELALITHLVSCQTLIVENLGAFGPLKCKELIAIEKLKVQASIIGRLLKLVKQVKTENKVISGAKEINDCSEIQLLWEQCTEDGKPLCITADMLSWRLQEIIDNSSCVAQHSLSAEAVKLIVTEILNDADFQSEHIATVFQFQSYFLANRPVKEHIRFVLNTVLVLDSLHTGDVWKIKKCIDELSRKALPSKDVVKELALLLLNKGTYKENIAYFLENLSQNESWRDQISVMLVEFLESSDAETRHGACVALKYFQPYDYMEQLVYIAQNDENNSIRLSARSTLLTLGEFGREALERNFEENYDEGSLTAL